jgi:Protein of unknown function (DUF742)
MPAADKWMDRSAGPVVRPYALTGGRTGQTDGQVLDLIAIVVAQQSARGTNSMDLTPEDRMIMGLCQRPVTVTDVASRTRLPLGVVRVLLADLIKRGRISVLPANRSEDQPSTELLKEVLHGLRAL